MDIEKDFKLFAKDKLNISGNKVDKLTNTLYTPYVLEERKLNCQSLDIFSRMLYDRIVFFNGEVNEDSSNLAIAQLLYLDSIEHRDINFYINSPGGSVADGLAIYDTMNFINSDISTIAIGIAASMASILLSSGTEGKRFALPHTRILIHQPRGSVGGKSTDMEIDLKEMQTWRTSLYEILSEKMGKPMDEIEKLCKDDKWFSAKEAVDMKIIDKVIEK